MPSFHFDLKFAIHLANAFVNSANKDNILPAPKETYGWKALDLPESIILVKIYDRQHDRLDLRLLDGKRCKIRPHLLWCSKILIGV